MKPKMSKTLPPLPPDPEYVQRERITVAFEKGAEALAALVGETRLEAVERRTMLKKFIPLFDAAVKRAGL